MISAIQAVGAGLARAQPSPIVDRAVEIARRALRAQRPDRLVPDLEALAMPDIGAGTLPIETAFLLDRMLFMLTVLGDVRDGMRALRFGLPPRRIVEVPVHQDYFAIFLNAFRLLIAVGIVSVLGVWSGQSETAQAILFTAVFVSLGAVQPNPAIMGKTALFGMPLVVVTGTIYSFLIFPNIDGYPLFILSLAPLVFVTCWLIKAGLPGAGLIYCVQSIVLISPANVQTLQPNSFVETATMLTISGIAIFLSIMLVLPVDPAQRRLRLAIAVGNNLRKALADEKHLPQPRASLHYDRMSQFKTWQRGEDASLARRKTMKRLNDMGNLAYAVRRSWRSLDAARPFVDPALDARARRVLPTLSPDETRDLARDYLRSATGRNGRPALDLVRAAAALYGTALVTTSEEKLLRRVKLLGADPMKEFVVAGLLVTPFVKYAILAGLVFLPLRFILIHLHFQKWVWHPLLAEGAIYLCILAILNLVFD